MCIRDRPHAHPSAVRIKDVIERTDMVTRLRLVQAYVYEIGANRWVRERDSVKLAADSVRAAVAKLRTLLDEAESELAEHATRYLQSWRSPNVEAAIDGLTLWSIRLEERLQALREVVQLAVLQYPGKEA